MKTKDSKIVIRPGKKYLIAIFLYIYITFMMIWVLCKVGPSEILETKWAGVLPLLLLSSSLGIYFLVFVLFTKTEVSDKKIFPWLYEKAKDDTKFYAKVGSRYHSLCILFAYASRCRIPFDEVYGEAEGRIEFYNRFVDEDDEVNKFTIDDVVCASKFYDPAFPKWITLDYYEKILGIKVKRNKRNGRTREQHLTKYLPYLRESGEIKDTRFGVEGGNKRGTRLGAKDKTVRSRTADSAEQVVRDYLSANPSARTSEIIRDTKLCKTTVCKWLRKIKGIDA